MENLGDEYNNYWETTMFFRNEELEYSSWAFEEALSGGSGGLSSPDVGTVTSPSASKTVVSEKNRRRRFNQRLFALRSVVPKISKLDRTSVIKDSIAYIKELQEQEKKLEAEIRELESSIIFYRNPINGYRDHSLHQELMSDVRSKKMKQIIGSSTVQISPIEALEMKVMWMGEKRGVVIITCNKERETMAGLCQVFESLNLKIITANFSSPLSGRLSATLFIEADEEERGILEAKILTAIAASNASNYSSHERNGKFI
ncbi:PREDICTED: transcription factor bHLH27 [Tarenaya hassleriana]|uniref:transcription factor bHLH27 n=1 Tax=Tarenaya hassleriana TaxID=28532 RepID=UPI00053C8948|nr:PREDICTED: transcription factor bHLH27 [Tarenaya hassleriana]